jgi:hypothetical protein
LTKEWGGIKLRENSACSSFTRVNVTVGDQGVLTYTETLAVSVEPAKKK